MDFLDVWARMLGGLWRAVASCGIGVLPLRPGCVAACGGLWHPVAPCGIGVLPLIISFDRRIEAWKLQSSRPGLMSWLVDLDGWIDWLIG